MTPEELNPYQPSATLLKAPSAVPGLWRDQSYLVTSLPAPTFPQKCVRTNVPCTGEPTILKLTWVPFHGIYAKRIALQVYISPGWMSRRHRGPMVGYGLLVLGMLGFFAMGFLQEPSVFGPLWFVASLVAVLSGFIAKINYDVPILRVVKLRKHYAWIGNVDLDFLEDLPPWPGEYST